MRYKKRLSAHASSAPIIVTTMLVVFCRPERVVSQPPAATPRGEIAKNIHLI